MIPEWDLTAIVPTCKRFLKDDAAHSSSVSVTSRKVVIVKDKVFNISYDYRLCPPASNETVSSDELAIAYEAGAAVGDSGEFEFHTSSLHNSPTEFSNRFCSAPVAGGGDGVS